MTPHLRSTPVAAGHRRHIDILIVIFVQQAGVACTMFTKDDYKLLYMAT